MKRLRRLLRMLRRVERRRKYPRIRGTAYRYTSIEVYINGVRLPGVQSIDYSFKR